MHLKQIKEYWRIIVVALILIINSVFQEESISSLLPNFIQVTYLNLVLFIVYVVLEALDKIESNKENKNFKTTIQNMDQKFDVSLQYFKEIRAKKRNLVKPLVDLINNNIISIKSIEDVINGKNFICIFCYQVGFSSNLPKIMRDEKQSPRRKYNELLEDLGFIKLASKYSYYIIAEDNLYPETLRNIDFLADYLMVKSKECVDEEWNIILEYSKEKAPTFYKKRVDATNPLNFNFLVYKINAKDIKHNFLIQNDFNPKFNTELATIASIREIHVSEKDKIKIKNFVLKSSLNILIGDLPHKQKENLMSLEPEFKTLGITHIYDYQKVNPKDLMSIINTKINSEVESEMLANIIIENSKNYEEILLELGVHLD